MPIVIDGFSVIVRKSTIESKYAGGLAAYVKDCPNFSYCADEHICRIGFMTFAEAEAFVWKLAAAGLTPFQDKASHEVAIAAPSRGFSKACSWLEGALHKEQVVVWLKDTSDRVARRAEFSPWEHKFAHQVEFVELNDDVAVYRDKISGELHSFGKAEAEAEEERRVKINQLYKKAHALIDGLISLEGAPLSREQTRRLEESVPLLKRVIEMHPGHWGAMWNLGKVYESLNGDVHLRFELFTRAHRLNPDEADVAREAGLAAILVGRNEDAMVLCKRAVALDPGDAGLRTNLALSLLLMGEVVNARTNILSALKQESTNDTIQHISKIVDEVAVGIRPCPRHIRDLE